MNAVGTELVTPGVNEERGPIYCLDVASLSLEMKTPCQTLVTQSIVYQGIPSDIPDNYKHSFLSVDPYIHECHLGRILFGIYNLKKKNTIHIHLNGTPI